MVNLLWLESNVEGTIALERLWNELNQEYTFSLLCGYSMKNFKDSSHGSGFQDVCGTHHRVLPAESYTNLDDQNSQMRLIAELQQKSMALQTEVAGHRSTEVALRKSEEELKKSNEELKSANEELRRVNEELRRANEETQIANRAKNTFLANIRYNDQSLMYLSIYLSIILIYPYCNIHCIA